MPADSLESQFAEALQRSQLLVRGSEVVAGVSGGADSVAMLHLLAGLNGDGWGLRIHVAHLNHLLRGAESDGDADFVQRLADGLGLPCVIASADVRQRAHDEGISIEQAARRCRFELFERVCLRLDIRLVALAHHADDNAETILHRIVRGTGLRGLGGIRPSRLIREGSGIRVVRPLLSFRRSELEEYLQGRGISFRHDSTNDLDSYTRNRIRNEILPLLCDRVNPQAVEALNRLAEQARGIDEYLTETAERMLEPMIIEQDDRQLVLHRPSLARKPHLIQTQLIRQAMLRLGIGEAEMTYGHLNAVADMTGESEGSRAMDLPGGLRVVRRYDRLLLERSARSSQEPVPACEARVAIGGKTFLPAHGMELTVDMMPADAGLIADHIHQMADRDRVSHEEWVDAEQVHPPLVARFRRPGDRFFPLGMNGMKKLSDFFIDEKIDADVRERTVVLCDHLGPVWIVPLRIDERVRLTETTRQVMRLVAREVSAANR
jgi:tRNA(Ile)-lysidine synthase